MRDKLKKIIEGAESALIILAWTLFWVALSPIVAIRWIFAIFWSGYHYCKFPKLTFFECLRYEMVDTGRLGEIDNFDFCYFPRKPFDRDEHVRVREIIRGF